MKAIFLAGMGLLGLSACGTNTLLASQDNRLISVGTAGGYLTTLDPGTVAQANVEGEAGVMVSLRPSPTEERTHALTGLSWGEWTDRPCTATATYTSLFDPTKTVEVTSPAFAPSGEQVGCSRVLLSYDPATETGLGATVAPSQTVDIVLSAASNGEPRFANQLNVCQSGQQDIIDDAILRGGDANNVYFRRRIKGVAIDGETRDGSAQGDEAIATLSNCAGNDVAMPQNVMCPTSSFITGVDLIYARELPNDVDAQNPLRRNDPRYSIVGMQFSCRPLL